MKKVISLILIFLLVLTHVSCNSDTGIENESEKEDLSSETNTEKQETEAPIVYNTLDLSNFCITFTDSIENMYAVLLQNKLKEVGVTLSSRRASSAEIQCEIFFSKSNCDLAKKCAEVYDRSSAQYGVMVDGTKILIAGEDLITVERSIDYFVDKYVTNGASIVIEDKITTLFDVDREKDLLPSKAEEGNLRLLCNNIVMMRNSYGQKHERLDMLKTAYSVVDPDIIALQECDRYWRNEWGIVDGMKDIGFEITPITDEYPNPIFYKSAKFRCLEGDSVEYECTAAGHPDRYDFYWSYTWALLEEIASGKKLIVLSTHLVSYSVEQREESIKVLMSVISALEDKYGVPVISCGD